MTKKRESRMWERLRPHLAGLDAVRVEAPESQGIPDVNYVRGWIELKRIAAWPRRYYSIVRIPSLTPEQRAWAQRRCRSGGTCWLLLHVEEADDWLLFDMSSPHVSQLVGASTRVQHETMTAWRAIAPDGIAWSGLRGALNIGSQYLLRPSGATTAESGAHAG